MEDKRSPVDRLGGLEGADAAALGTDTPPESAPPGARVDAEERLVPGTGFDDVRRDEAKPWFTSLAAESSQAGVPTIRPTRRSRNFRPIRRILASVTMQR